MVVRTKVSLTDVELFLGHLVEDRVAKYSGIIDDTVDPTEVVYRCLDDFVCAVPFGHAVKVGDGCAAESRDFVDNFSSRAGVSTLATGAASQVIDYYFCAVISHHHGDGPTDAAARPGNDDNFTVQHFLVTHSLLFSNELIGSDWPPSDEV